MHTHRSRFSDESFVCAFLFQWLIQRDETRAPYFLFFHSTPNLVESVSFRENETASFIEINSRTSELTGRYEYVYTIRSQRKCVIPFYRWVLGSMYVIRSRGDVRGLDSRSIPSNLVGCSRDSRDGPDRWPVSKKIRRHSDDSLHRVPRLHRGGYVQNDQRHQKTARG